MQVLQTGPDDERFAAWCEVWAVSERADGRDELHRPARDHVALERRLVTPGGSMDGTHPAAVACGSDIGWVLNPWSCCRGCL